ncbi:MAG: hypothetical protein RIE32_06985 [Phycisphaerales bacterium]
MIPAWLFTAAALAFLIGMVWWARRVERGRFGFAAHYFPRLCAASQGPRARDLAPPWLGGLRTLRRELGGTHSAPCAVLDDLLDGSIEIACLWQHDRVVAFVRCPGVLVADDLAQGNALATTGPMMQGRRGLRKVATLRSEGRRHEPINVWHDRMADARVGLHDAAELSLRGAFAIGYGRGLSAIEIHAGEVFLLFDGHGKGRLEPHHIAAIVEALDVKQEGDRAASVPIRP